MVAASFSGSIIVYRNELSPSLAVEWIVKLHENLLFGETGRLINGIGAFFLTLVCSTGAVIWWPGTKNWRPAKRASKTPKSTRVFGQRQEPAKMFRAGLYARVSTHDQQTLPLQMRAMR